MRELMEACYRDGWNDALTAQPPAEIITVSEEEWEHFIATMNAPATPNEKLMELLTKRPPWESEPPQPGDAERRRAQLEWDIVHAPGYREAAAIALREFDTAQSAIAESRAEVGRLRHQLSMAVVDRDLEIARLSKSENDWIRRTATAVATTGRVQNNIDEQLAAARAQGVREERERHHPLIDAAQAVLAQYAPYEIVDAEAALQDALSAVTAPETQEKKDG